MNSSVLITVFVLLLLVNLTLGFRAPFVKKRANLFMSSTVSDVNKKESARSYGLALQLDEGTRKSHSIAENTAFVTGFFKGLANREIFSKLVCSLYHVYATMENVLDQSTDINVKPLDFPELRRKQSLEKDMQFYFGADWRAVKPSPATTRYCDHIKATAVRAPYLMVAHQYTRYLGDLFGGQMMGGMATKSLGLSDGQGIAFYRFDSIKDNKAFIEQWYAELNKLDLTEAQKDEIVEEGNVVFRYNIDIFEELEGNGLVATLKFAFTSIWRSIFKK